MFVDASCTYTGADATVSILNADDVTITADGSCYIADTSANITESAVYSDSVPLTLDCTGTLSIDGNSKEGITVSKAAFVIEKGDYILNTVGNGLQPKGKGTSLVINGGTFPCLKSYRTFFLLLHFHMPRSRHSTHTCESFS